MNWKAKYVITADNRQAKQAFAEIDQIQKKSFAGRGGSGVADVFGGNIASQAVTNLTAKLYEGGQAIFNYSQEVAGARLAFESLMGSATAAGKHIKDLEALSRSTPLKFESIAGMSQRLQGAGVEAGRVIEMIKDIGNVAAATGKLTEERMDGIGLALSQVFTKGKVSAEEMNQLAERGVPAWRILSQQLGKTTGELQKMAEKGEITADVMITAFQNFSKQNYGNAMEKQAAVFGSAWQNIQNVILQSSSGMFKPATDAMAKFAADTAKSLKDQEKQWGQAGVSLGYALGEAIGRGIREWRRSPDGQDLALLFQNPQMYFAKQLAAGIAGFQAGNSPPQMLPPAIDYTSPRSPGQRRRPGAVTPGGTPVSENIRAIQQQADQQRRLAEQMAERDLAAAIRIEEMNFATIRDQFDQQFDEILDVFGESGNISDLFTGMTDAMARYKDSIGASLRFLEELENRGRSAMTEHEQALLTAQQMERRQEIVKEGQELAKKNNALLLEQHVKMGELAIARYQREKDIADEVERQAAAFREVHQSMLMMPGYDANGVETMSPNVSPPGFSDGLFGEGGLNIIRDEAMEVGQIYNDLGMMVGDTIGQMIDGVGSLVEAWVLYGDLGPQAVRKMTASILAGLAAQAAVKAIFQLAEGFAALFFNPAEAAAHFKAAALYGAVAVGAGLAGRAIAGDAFKNEGGSGSSSSAGSSRASSSSLTPISRQDENTFISSRNPWQQANDRMVQVLDEFQRKISSMPADHVVTMGAKKASGAIAAATVDGMRKNATHATNMRRTMGT